MFTDDVRSALEEAKAILSSDDCLMNARLAYRIAMDPDPYGRTFVNLILTP